MRAKRLPTAKAVWPACSSGMSCSIGSMRLTSLSGSARPAIGVSASASRAARRWIALAASGEVSVVSERPAGEAAGGQLDALHQVAVVGRGRSDGGQQAINPLRRG